MVSKNELKLITSLQQKKYRDREGLFVAEGPKIIQDFINAGASLFKLFALENVLLDSGNRVQIDAKSLKKISALRTPNGAVAIFKKFDPPRLAQEGVVLCLDQIQDPGNLGTIIRLADWFGVAQVVCSLESADCYNAKVVQATMGSLARVPVCYTALVPYLNNHPLAVFGGFMEGSSVYKTPLPKEGVLVMGNEGNGISKEVAACIKHKISIPNLGSGHTESLNVATATAILLSEFKRSTEK